MKKGAKWIITAIIWVFAIYIGYYIFHKPFSLANASAVLSKALDVSLWLCVFFVALAFGHVFTKRLDYGSPVEEMIFCAGLGFGALSIFTFGLGLAGLLRPWLFRGLLLFLLVALRRHILAMFNCISGSFEGELGRNSLLESFLKTYLGTTLLIAFFSSLTPPYAWDSQVYHLTGPKLYIRDGRITAHLEIPYLGFPQLMEMLFLLGILLKGDVISKLFHFSFGLLTLLALYAFARRHFGEETAWLSATIFYSVPSIVLISTWAYVDLGLVFYGFAALYALVMWLEMRQRSWLFISSVLCGLGMGVKYTAIALLFALSFIIVKRKGIRRELFLFASLAVLVASPWYLKSFYFTGNPFYPFAFGGAGWDDFRSRWFVRAGTGLAYTEPWRILIAPWEMTILGIEGKVGYEATIGPLILSTFPFLALIWRNLKAKERSIISPILVFCLIQYAFWLCGVAISKHLSQTRLIFPIFAPLSILSGYVVSRLSFPNQRFSLRFFVKMAVLLALSLNLVSAGLRFIRDNPLLYLTGMESEADYLERHLGSYYGIISYVNESLPSSSKVLFLWEPRSYYCKRECIPDAILDRFKHLVYKYTDADGIARYLRGEGITHVLLNVGGLEYILETHSDPITPDDLEILRELQIEHLKVVYKEGDSYLLYEVI